MFGGDFGDKIGNEIRVQLIRHGKTLGNEEKRYIGVTDEPLSEKGRYWLVHLRDKMNRENEYCDRTLRPDVVFSSPMKRCIETAELLFPDNEICIIPELREIDFGEFEGKNYMELSDNLNYLRWIDSNGTIPFPGGESREEFIDRQKDGWKKIFREVQEKATDTPIRSIAVVCHGGSIMSIMSSFFKGEYFDYQVGNGEGYLVSADVAGNITEIVLE